MLKDSKPQLLNGDTVELFSHRLTVGELDVLLADLAKLRARMHPTFSVDFPHGQAVEVVKYPSLSIEPEARNLDCILHLRHPGLGWLHFVLPGTELEGFAEALLAQAQGYRHKARIQ